MLFLVNPGASRPVRRRAAKAAKKAAKRKKVGAGALGVRPSRGKQARPTSTSSRKTRRNGGKQMAAKKKGRKPAAKTASRKRRRKVATKRSPVQRLARGKVYVTNGRKRRGVRRRSYRRNGVRGLGGTLMRAGKDALGVVGGVVLTNLIARRIPYGDGNRAIEVAKKVAVAAALGMLVRRVAGSQLAEKVVVGGMVAVANDLLSAVPVVGTALSGDDTVRAFAAYSPAYALPSGMSAYDNSGFVATDPAASYRN